MNIQELKVYLEDQVKALNTMIENNSGDSRLILIAKHNAYLDILKRIS